MACYTGVMRTKMHWLPLVGTWWKRTYLATVSERTLPVFLISCDAWLWFIRVESYPSMAMMASPGSTRPCAGVPGVTFNTKRKHYLYVYQWYTRYRQMATTTDNKTPWPYWFPVMLPNHLRLFLFNSYSFCYISKTGSGLEYVDSEL